MDRYSGKRGVTGSIAPKKTYKLDVKDATTSKDQFCNRIGCQGRIKYSNQNAKMGSSDKAKCSRPSSFCSSNGNTSRSSSSVMTRAKSSYLDSKRKLASESEVDPSSHHSGSTNTSRETKLETSSCMPSSSTRPRRTFQSNTQAASSISKSSGLGTTTLNNNSKKSSRCLKNLKCNTVSDANCASSKSKLAAKNMMTKRSLEEAESSLSRRGRNTTATPSTSGVSVRRPSGEDSSGAASVRSRRSTYVNQNRPGQSYRQNVRNNNSAFPSLRTSLRFPGSGPPITVGSSRSLLRQPASSDSSSYSHSISNDENRSPFNSADLGFSHLMSRDALQRYNMDGGMAEVLMELERLEQDEEMTHEQILALEASLYLSSRSMYDQHREMRLDIDNMSYEELLALGERMGTVSTALSEDALSKCVRRSLYQVNSSEEQFTGSGEDGDGDDVNCSICQEEYEMGEEVGKLVECQHVYHTTCINQWLRLKNWCPICKTCAAPQEEAS